MDPVRLSESLAVTGALEALAGELACLSATDAQINEIRALHYEMLAAFTRRDLSTYYRLNAQIHALINAAARNPLLTQTWRNVNARLQALRFRSNFDEAKWKRAVGEHERMVELLAAHEGPALRTLLVTHLENKRDVVLELIRAGTLHGAVSA
jgi:DNA-binding GntR family transcriptional regulator